MGVGAKDLYEIVSMNKLFYSHLENMSMESWAEKETEREGGRETERERGGGGERGMRGTERDIE